MEWGRNENPTKVVELDQRFTAARAELLRQRRLLLWITFVLVFYYCAGVQLGHEAESQGVKLHIERPELLVLAAWIGWVWAYWRYWQYERTHPDGSYQLWRERQMWLTAVGIGARKVLNEAAAGEVAGIPRGGEVSVSIDRDITTQLTMDGGLHLKNFGIQSINPEQKRAASGTGDTSLSSGEFEYAKREGQRAFLFARPYVLDYKAPYFIGLLAPSAALWRLLH
jgi:hypothetical protein